MAAFVSFRASDVAPDKLEAILARHVEYERVRLLRALVVRRLLAVLFFAFVFTRGIPLFSWVGFQLVSGVLTAAITVAVGVEWMARRRISRELEGTPAMAQSLRQA